MNDVKISGWVVSVIIGWSGGSVLLGGLGKFVAGPLVDDNTWLIIGGVVATVLLLFGHHHDRKRTLKQKKRHVQKLE